MYKDPSGVTFTTSRRPVYKCQASAFTLIELLVVIAIVAILSSLILPSLHRAKLASKNTLCKSNLRQQGFAIHMYLSDTGVFPHTVDANSATTWYLTLAPNYGTNYGILNCPTFKGEWPIEKALVWVFGNAYHRSPSTPNRISGVSYGYNGFGVGSANATHWTANLGLGIQVNAGQASPPVPESAVRAPVDMIAIADSMPQPGFTNIFPFLLSISSVPSPERHNGGANILFVDGHVITQPSKRLVENAESNRRRWNIDNEPHFEIPF